MNWCGVFAFILLAIIAQILVGPIQQGKVDVAWKGPNGFGWQTTAEEVSEGVDLTGKVALITGANSDKGLGFENARVFALRGAHVVVSARSLVKAEEAIKQLKARLPSGQTYKFSALACDLGSLKSVDQAVRDFKAMNLKLHYLIANAGIMALPERTVSVDGYEMQVAVNHLGHFHLVNQLADTLVASAPARVVFVSSLAHEDATTPRAFLESDNLEMPYAAWGTYGDSKLSNIITAKEFNEQYKSKGVTAYALHPGIIETNLARSAKISDMLDFMMNIPVFAQIAPTVGRSIAQGTATQVYAALKAPETEAGLYLSHCNVEKFGSRYKQADAGLLDNAAVRAKFWATSEKLVKQALAK